jgi:lincosamide nucleotidyltransferase
MERAEYDRFTARLRASLEGDGRVLGLVALGSMSGEPPEADAWSDHDFFVVTRPGEQEEMRTHLDWLPDPGTIAFHYRETAHGVSAIYRSGHLVEFAVFDPDELQLASVNRYRTLLDRGGVEQRMRDLRERTAAERRGHGRDWLWGQFLTALLVGSGRFRRGERMSGRALLLRAATQLCQLAGSGPDSLDPLRRVEARLPDLDAAFGKPVPEGAAHLLALASRLPGFPAEAAEAIAPHLG